MPDEPRCRLCPVTLLHPDSIALQTCFGCRRLSRGEGDAPPASGGGDFDAFARGRFVLKGEAVVMLPDPRGGRWSVGMTPEQCEFLAGHLRALARLARAERGRRRPELFPEDAEAE